MPPLVIAAGIGAAGAFGGAALQARASGKAAKTNELAATEALNFEKQQYADEQARLQPYRETGAATLGQLSQRLGQAPQAMPMPAGAMSLGQMQSRGQMVTIMAPTGATKQVPQSELSHWESKGARRVA